MTSDLQARLEQALRDMHRYEGLCPDDDQPLERDRECSACQALVLMSDVLRERAEAGAQCAAQLDAVKNYFEHYGAEHETRCPEDDTCDCEFVVALNKAFGPGNAGASLLRELQALRRVRQNVEGIRKAAERAVSKSNYTREQKELVDACAEADASKEKTP